MNNNIIITAKLNCLNSLDFYAEKGNQSYYIFTRKFRPKLYKHFKNGVSIHKLFDFSKAYGDEIIISTIEQLRFFLRFIEKEYGIKLLRERKTSPKRKMQELAKTRFFREEDIA